MQMAHPEATRSQPSIRLPTCATRRQCALPAARGASSAACSSSARQHNASTLSSAFYQHQKALNSFSAAPACNGGGCCSSRTSSLAEQVHAVPSITQSRAQGVDSSVFRRWSCVSFTKLSTVPRDKTVSTSRYALPLTPSSSLIRKVVVFAVHSFSPQPSFELLGSSTSEKTHFFQFPPYRASLGENGRAAAGSLLHVKTEHDGMPEASNEICTSPAPGLPWLSGRVSHFFLLSAVWMWKDRHSNDASDSTEKTPFDWTSTTMSSSDKQLATHTAKRQLRTATTGSSWKPSASRLRTLEVYERNCNACIEFNNILRMWHHHTGPAESQAVARNMSRNRSSHHHLLHRRRLQAFSALTNATFTPLAGCSTISDLKPGKDSFLSSILSYVCKIRVTVYAISVNANCWPMQIRGPPLKGMYLRDAVSLSHV